MHNHAFHGGPLPGGPFPRIGKTGYESESFKVPTLLSRWLNRRRLPELYTPTQSTTDEYEAKYKQALAAAEKIAPSGLNVAACLGKLATFYCATLSMVKGEQLFTRAISIKEKTLGQDNLALVADLDDLAALSTIEGKGASAAQFKLRVQAVLSKHKKQIGN